MQAVGSTRRAVGVRFAAASLLLVVIGLEAAAPSAVAACQAAPIPFEARLERATLIVRGLIIERRFEGGSGYDLRVAEVFTGDAPDVLSLGAIEDPGMPPMCGQTFEVGDEVVLAIVSPDDLSNIGAWTRLPDGNVDDGAFTTGSPPTFGDLLGVLRQRYGGELRHAEPSAGSSPSQTPMSPTQTPASATESPASNATAVRNGPQPRAGTTPESSVVPALVVVSVVAAGATAVWIGRRRPLRAR